jgi:hypothetical protein
MACCALHAADRLWRRCVACSALQRRSASALRRRTGVLYSTFQRMDAAAAAAASSVLSAGTDARTCPRPSPGWDAAVTSCRE